MNLNPQEQKMMVKLRKWQRDWRWAKWAILIAGIIYVGIGFNIYHDITEEPTGITQLLFIAFASPFLAFFSLGGSILIALSIIYWHGFMTDTLLLKVLDERAGSHQG